VSYLDSTVGVRPSIAHRPPSIFLPDPAALVDYFLHYRVAIEHADGAAPVLRAAGRLALEFSNRTFESSDSFFECWFSHR